jgi:phenylacetate-coenzyme A ligase PaaK-like adenylate-forming protein
MKGIAFMENQVYVFGEFHQQQEIAARAPLVALMEQARSKVTTMQELLLDKILIVFDRLGKLWQNEEYPYRQKVFYHLTHEEKMSPQAANRDLDMVSQLLRVNSLRRRLATSFPYPLSVLDQWYRPLGFAGKIRALPRGILVHICAGNVFLGALDSLIMGIVSKNVNIVKLPSHDPAMLLHFLASLQMEDQEGVIARSIAVLKWGRDDKEMEDVAVQYADTIMVWGGEEAISAYKRKAASHVEVLGYGPKISFAVIAATKFNEANFAELAALCAHDICMYDQKACSSPQDIFIQSGDRTKIRKFLDALDKALSRELSIYPATEMNGNELAEVLKYRETMKFHAAQNKAIVAASATSGGYTAVFTEEPSLEYSPLYRFVYLKSFNDSKDLSSRLAGMRPYLQSAGIAAAPAEWVELEYRLTAAGVTRVTELGHMLDVQDGAPHDGTLPLSSLVRWVNNETATRLPNHESYTREFLHYVAEQSLFYRQFWRDAQWDKPDFFSHLPLLTKEMFYQVSPPESDDILTAKPPRSPLIFSTGGSTGRPKYSYFTHEEFDRIATGLADEYILHGLGPQDMVANLFVAGHLWSSFLVVDRALNKIGVANLPIGGHIDLTEVAKYLATFKPTALFGLPSTLSGLLNHCLQKKIALKIDKIFYAGEHISAAMSQNFQKHWATNAIHSAGYASADAGLIGYQCPQQSSGTHHLFSDLILLELVSPDGNVVAKPGVEGEIVVTTLYRKLMPMVRYKTGDLGQYDDKPCGCGRHDAVFQLLGRCDDRLQIGGARVMVQDIDKLLRRYEMLTGVYQFVPQYKNGAEFLQVFIEYTPGCGFSKGFAEQFEQEFYEVFSDLARSVQQKWLHDPEILIVPEGSIPRVERTRKVKLIDDKRKAK